MQGCRGLGKWFSFYLGADGGGGEGATSLSASRGRVDKERRQENDSGHECFLNPFYFVCMFSCVYTCVCTGISTHLSVCWWRPEVDVKSPQLLSTL